MVCRCYLLRRRYIRHRVSNLPNLRLMGMLCKLHRHWGNNEGKERLHRSPSWLMWCIQCRQRYPKRRNNRYRERRIISLRYLSSCRMLMYLDRRGSRCRWCIGFLFWEWCMMSRGWLHCLKSSRCIGNWFHLLHLRRRYMKFVLMSRWSSGRGYMLPNPYRLCIFYKGPTHRYNMREDIGFCNHWCR